MQAPCPPGYPFGMFNRTLAWAAGLIAVLALAVGGYLAYAAAQKRVQQRQVAEMVRDTTEKLRQALAPKPASELVAAIDANLKAARAPRDPGLADAAEHYILGAREIARRRVETERLARQAASSRQALAGHMARAARRSDGWMRDALALKKRVETDYFDLGVTLKATDDLLFKLQDSEKRLQPPVGTDSPLEAAVVAAREMIRRSSLRASASKRRMPSASLSVAIWSSFSSQRKAVSSSASFG